MAAFAVISSAIWPLAFTASNSLHLGRMGTVSTRRADVRLADPRTIAEFDAEDFEPAWPYEDDYDFKRIDESADFNFYMEPRFVTHIDDGAIAALTEYYRRALPEGGALLDLCSSWISHLPPEIAYSRVAGVGMNYRELEMNKRLTEFAAQDLNADPKLPYGNNEFDAVLNVVSVDYMTQPRQLFSEMHRVLRPGGIAVMSFSNRCFPSKAVKAWLEADETGRLAIVANYFHFCGQPWSELRALDLNPLKKEGLEQRARTVASSANANSNPFASFMAGVGATMGSMDPMFVVEARAIKSA